MQATTEGTGLTKSTLARITSGDSEGSIWETIEKFNAPGTFQSMRDLLNARLEEIRAWLEERGLPSDERRRVVLDQSRNWRYVEKDWRPESLAGGLDICFASECIKSVCEVDSAEWYAAEAIHFAWRLEVADNTEKAVEAGMRLAQINEQARWKFNHEPAALKGYKFLENSKTGRVEASKALKRKTRERHRCIVVAAKGLLEDEPLLVRNDSALARRIAEKNLPDLISDRGIGLSQSAIRRHLREARKAGEL